MRLRRPALIGSGATLRRIAGMLRSAKKREDMAAACDAAVPRSWQHFFTP
jgi:hypothetical protein